MKLSTVLLVLCAVASVPTATGAVSEGWPLITMFVLVVITFTAGSVIWATGDKVEL